MEILATITALLSIVDQVLSFKSRLTDSERKSDLSCWLMDISVLMQGIAQDFKKEIYPHAKCGQLAYFLDNVRHVLEPSLEEAEVNYLADLIMQAHQVERLFGELNLAPTAQRDLNLAKLEEISGVFFAASKTVMLK